MSVLDASLSAYAGTVVDFLGHPDECEQAMRVLPRGVLVVRQGKVEWLGRHDELPHSLRKLAIKNFGEQLLLPGFIDTHTHYPQAEMIACYGEQLLEWLNEYTFPTESAFAEPEHAGRVAEFFVQELVRQGTTCAMVFASSHTPAVDALFAAAERRHLCLITGKVLMDRHAPAGLCTEPEQAYAEARALIERWHKRQRLYYAITPRFAPSCSPACLDIAGRLKREYPDTYVQTHLAENQAEVAWVRQLYPAHDSYLGVYEHYGLVGPQSMFAHCLHLEEGDWFKLAARKAAIAHCPSSNFFLGSGLLPWQKARESRVKLSIGTDVGAGTSLSLLATLGDAYKGAALQGQRLSAQQAFYYLTLGGATALGLEGRLGNFALGKDADFVVLDTAATPAQVARRNFGRARALARGEEAATAMADQLFSLMMMGDDRSITATYAAGHAVYERSRP